jgi:hypothetical protein
VQQAVTGQQVELLVDPNHRISEYPGAGDQSQAEQNQA